MPELIIFDCDGVLVDSEPLANRVFAEMLGEIGLPLTLDEMFEHFVGRSMPQCLETIETMRGRPAPQGFLDELHKRTEHVFRDALEPVPGVAGVLDWLDEREIPYCVASSGSHEKMQLTLGLTGLLPRFRGRIFSVSDVVRGKPAPDVFVHAARQCHVRAECCTVIEDSPSGIKAGIAAGARVFAYAARAPEERLAAAGADIVFSHMAQLPALLSV